MRSAGKNGVYDMVRTESRESGENGVPTEDGEHGVLRMGEHGVPRMGEHGVPRMGEHGVPMGERGEPRMGEHGVPRISEHEVTPEDW